MSQNQEFPLCELYTTVILKCLLLQSTNLPASFKYIEHIFGAKNFSISRPPATCNGVSPKSVSISMECVEGSSGWKPQLNTYGNAPPYYGEKTEQLIDGYQANICRLGALISLFQSSKSSLQNMSLKRRQFKTEDRIISGILMCKKQT